MRVRQPPSSLTAPLQGYLQEIASALNALPNVSTYTGNTPEGRVLGSRGDLALQVDSVFSLDSMGLAAGWFLNMNAPNVVSTLSWRQIGVL